ncbi:MAG TPA: hypothetical protein VHN15_14020 [Thermoanaerobaculia bacterium]|nr:hypothetical protein [Thermoanaerobaculia bacterium]
MADDSIRERWPHIRRDAKLFWGKLTDDDCERVAGNRERLISYLQGRYRWSREKAESEIELFLETVETPVVVSFESRLEERRR